MKRKDVTKYSVNNKKFTPTELHGERFYHWFCREFGLKDEPTI